jgi:hypothetical protein
MSEVDKKIVTHTSKQSQANLAEDLKRFGGGVGTRPFLGDTGLLL